MISNDIFLTEALQKPPRGGFFFARNPATGRFDTLADPAIHRKIMSFATTPPPPAVPQGFFSPAEDRMPLMPREAMSPAQREAADALIAGPRKAVFGPFIPLLRSPQLMGRIGDVGAYLRFESALTRASGNS
jgi:hypothetical protein